MQRPPTHNWQERRPTRQVGGAASSSSGLAVVLPALAALPPWTLRRSSFSTMVTRRRLETGLVGTAVLASAAIGPLITSVAA